MIFVDKDASDHCLKSVQIRVFAGPYIPVFSPSIAKYEPEKTPYLDTFYAVINLFFLRN